LRFEWDKEKDRRKKKKHGISFGTAALVFDDPFHLSRLDRSVEVNPGGRRSAIAEGMPILLVSHTWIERDNQEIVRIIAARKATPRERSIYAPTDWQD
jgi:uncharacterized DUF497 family protein